MNDLPWSQINDCLLESSAACQPKEMLQLVLTGIGRLIPFDVTESLVFLIRPAKLFTGKHTGCLSIGSGLINNIITGF